MKKLLESQKIREQRVNEKFSYILEKEYSLNQMEYKVMQSQGGTQFVKCMSMLFNGKGQLLYMPGDLKSLQVMCRGIDEKVFLTIVDKLLKSVVAIKKNGFLSCQNIEVSSDKIYVDPYTCETRLVYVPIQPKVHEDYTMFEEALRTEMTRLINTEFSMHSDQMRRLHDNLSNRSIKLEDLDENKNQASVQQMQKPRQKMRLIALNAPQSMTIEVAKDILTIGRNASLVDVVVGFNTAIGRKHCTILRNNADYMIKDESSINGTFVNDERIASGQVRRLENGDIVGLANTKFKVLIDL